MAYPTLVGTSTSAVSFDIDHPVPIPSGSAGDLLVVMFVCVAGSQTLSLSGFTTLLNMSSSSNTLSVYIGYKTSTGSESGLFINTAATCESVIMTRRFSGWTAIEGGNSATANSSTATVSSKTVSGTADRMWVSFMGAVGNRTGIPTPGLSNEHSENQSWASVHSGTLNSTSTTVSMGSYSLGATIDWVTQSVIITGSAATPDNELTIDVQLGNVAPTITVQVAYESSINAGPMDIVALGNMIALPDARIVLGNVSLNGALFAFTQGPEQVQLGNVESSILMRSTLSVARCKVWDGSAWVTAVPKVWHEPSYSWVEATSVKIFLGGQWVEIH